MYIIFILFLYQFLNINIKKKYRYNIYNYFRDHKLPVHNQMQLQKFLLEMHFHVNVQY